MFTERDQADSFPVSSSDLEFASMADVSGVTLIPVALQSNTREMEWVRSASQAGRFYVEDLKLFPSSLVSSWNHSLTDNNADDDNDQTFLVFNPYLSDLFMLHCQNDINESSFKPSTIWGDFVKSFS